MLSEIDPKIFGLNSRVKLYSDNIELIKIVKQRKSRLIMKDGIKILEIANSIYKIKPHCNIEVLISGPICSKTIKFLEMNDITVVNE